MKLAVRYLALLYLCALLVVWGFIHFDTGTLWPVTLFLFSPRWVVALPLILLAPLSLAYQFRLTLLYAIHVIIILFPIMGYHISLTSRIDENAGHRLRVMTCNVGGGFSDYDQLTALVISQNIQVLMLQECQSSISKTIFEELGWTFRQEHQLAIGSCFELGEMQILARQPPSHYNMVAAAACELEYREREYRELEYPTAGVANEVSSYRVNLVCVHLPTFRPAFEEARAFEAESGAAIIDVGEMYRDIAEQLQQRLIELDNPLLIGGDFNVPVESAYYREHWSNYKNALSVAGNGFTYTKFTRLHGIRIDHFLVPSNWNVDSAFVGENLGGDHRPVIVEVSWAN